MNRNSSPTDAQANAWGFSSWGTPTTRFIPAFVVTTCSDFSINVASNANTTDGATLRVTDSLQTISMSIVADQATGFFNNTADTITFPAGERYGIVYDEGNTSLLMRGTAIRITMSQ